MCMTLELLGDEKNSYFPFIQLYSVKWTLWMNWKWHLHWEYVINGKVRLCLQKEDINIMKNKMAPEENLKLK